MRRRTKPRTLSLGTISSGTLRPEDVIPELLYAAYSIRMSRADRATVRKLAREWAAMTDDDGDILDSARDSNPDADAEIWQELADLLESYTPDYCYVGSIEGDGADIGVWPVSEVLMGEYADECPRIDVSGNPRDFVPRSASHYIAVSDHGNATLYRRAGNRWVECWSVV
jgi:hypothetical protein